jgi:hypothetical protein
MHTEPAGPARTRTDRAGLCVLAAVASLVWAGAAPVGAGVAAGHPAVNFQQVLVQNNQVILQWLNPTDAAWTGTTVVGKPGTTAPTSETDGKSVYSGNVGYLSTPEIGPGPYAYAIFADYSDGSTVGVSVLIPSGTFTWSISPATVTEGAKATISGQVGDSVNREGLGSQTVSIIVYPPGGTVANEVIYQARTDPYGKFTQVINLNRSWAIELRYEGDSRHIWCYSTPILYTVGAALHLTAGKTTVTHGKAIALTVTMQPVTGGQRVQLQLQTNGKWKTVATKTAAAKGSATFTVTEKKKGSYKFGGYGASAPQLANGTSSTVKITVK